MPAAQPLGQEAIRVEAVRLPDAGDLDGDTYDLRPLAGRESRISYPDGYSPVLPAGVDPLALQDGIQVSAVMDRGKRRWSALEIAEQVNRVQELLTSGYRPNLIRQLLQKEYGMANATAEARLRAARQQMVADLNVYDRKEKVAQMVQQLEEVVSKALKHGREANVIGALRLQADLLQLYTNRST